MKSKEELKSLREKSIKALSSDLSSSKTDLIQARIKLGQEKKTYSHKVRDLRKKIARIKTIIYEKLAKELETNHVK